MLRVGILIEKPPFSFLLDQKPKGIAVDIWNEFRQNYIAKEISSSPEYLLEKLQNNELDVLIGPFSMSHARVKMFEFSKPFYISKLRLFTKESTMNWFHFFGIIVILYLLFTGIVSLINDKPFFPTGYEIIENFINRDDILDLKGAFGKTFNITLKVLSFCFTIIIVSIVTYLISLYKSTNEIDVKKMKGKRIGHIQSNFFEKVISDRNMIPVSFQNQLDLKNAFLSKQIDAVLDDEFIFKELFIKEYKHSPVLLLDDYGFVFRDKDLAREFNLFLIKLQESENTVGICQRYLEEKDVIYCQV